MPGQGAVFLAFPHSLWALTVAMKTTLTCALCTELTPHTEHGHTLRVLTPPLYRRPCNQQRQMWASTEDGLVSRALDFCKTPQVITMCSQDGERVGLDTTLFSNVISSHLSLPRVSYLPLHQMA